MSDNASELVKKYAKYKCPRCGLEQLLIPGENISPPLAAPAEAANAESELDVKLRKFVTMLREDWPIDAVDMDYSYALVANHTQALCSDLDDLMAAHCHAATKRKNARWGMSEGLTVLPEKWTAAEGQGGPPAEPAAAQALKPRTFEQTAEHFKKTGHAISDEMKRIWSDGEGQPSVKPEPAGLVAELQGLVKKWRETVRVRRSWNLDPAAKGVVGGLEQCADELDAILQKYEEARRSHDTEQA